MNFLCLIVDRPTGKELTSFIITRVPAEEENCSRNGYSVPPLWYRIARRAADIYHARYASDVLTGRRRPDTLENYFADSVELSELEFAEAYDPSDPIAVYEWEI